MAERSRAGAIRLGLLAGATALGCSGAFAYSAADAWIVREAEAALQVAQRSLPQGSSLTFERVEAVPLQLGARVHGLHLELAPGSGVRSVDAGEILLAQAGSGGDTVARLAAKELNVDLANGGKVTAASVSGDDLDIRTITDALATPDGILGLLDARLGRLEAQTLTITMDGGTVHAAAASLDGYAERRLRGLTLSGVDAVDRDGVKSTLAELRIGMIDAAALPRDQWPDDPIELARALDRGRIDDLVVTGLNIGGEDAVALAGLRLGRLGGGRLEDLVIDQVGVAGEGGRKASLGQLGIRLIDWSMVDLDRIAAAVASLDAGGFAIDGEEESQDEEQAGAEVETEEVDHDGMLAAEFGWLEIVGQLARLQLGPMLMTSLAGGDDDGDLTLQRIDFAGYADGRFAGLRIEGVAGEGENEEGERWAARLAHSTASPQVVLTIDLAAMIAAAPRTQEGLDAIRLAMSKVPWNGHSLTEDFALARSGQPGVTLAALEVTLGEPAGKRHTEIAVRDLMIAPLALSKDMPEDLPVIGRQPVRMSMRFGSDYDPDALTFDIQPLSITAIDLGGSELKLATRLGADPAVDPITAATGGVLIGAELVYRDAGMVERLLQGMERDSKKKRTELAQGLVRDLRRSEPGKSLIDQQRATELESFLKKPRTLSIALKPKKPVPLMTVGMAALAPQKQTAASLGLEIKAIDK